MQGSRVKTRARPTSKGRVEFSRTARDDLNGTVLAAADIAAILAHTFEEKH